MIPEAGSVLSRVESWLEMFHRVATNPSGERDRVLKFRRCVEWNNVFWDDRERFRWSEWKNGIDRFSQELLDAESEFELIRPEVVVAHPDLIPVLDRSHEGLDDLLAAIQNATSSADIDDVCRQWFIQQQRLLRQLQSKEPEPVFCRGCGEWFGDAENFEAHFFRFLKPHCFPCGNQVANVARLSDAVLDHHIAEAHLSDSPYDRTIYIDTDEQVQAMSTAIEKCRAAYREALALVLAGQSFATNAPKNEPRTSPVGSLWSCPGFVDT